jgi:hypothetical protein
MPLKDNPYIGRIVVLISPLIAALATAIVYYVQEWTGAKLDDTELTVLLTAAVLGVFKLIDQWLKNRGQYEADKRDGKIEPAAGLPVGDKVPDSQGDPTG